MKTLYAKDIIEPVEAWINPLDSIEAGCIAIQSQKSHIVILGEPKQATGLVSAGDVVNAIATGLDITTTPLMKIATTAITTIDEQTPLLECLSVFQGKPVRSLFVTKDGVITGSISKDIILAEHSAILDAAIAQATTDLQAVAEHRDTLLGTAAHDIRNPLGVILAWCELLDDMLDDHMSLEVAEGMETIRKQAEQILDILNQFLDVTKIEAGKVTLNKSEFDPASVIITAYKSNLMKAKKKMIPLENNAPLNLPSLYADQARIQTALSKLTQNAIKYSRAGETTTIDAYAQSGSLYISVQDTGQGIPVEEQEHIFTAFAKTTMRPTAGETGTGLGLVIAKKVIEMHGGTLTVQSVAGEGSTFTIELPLTPPNKG